MDKVAKRLREGWNDVNDKFCIYVKNGNVIRGMYGCNTIDCKTVFPYVVNYHGIEGKTNISGIKVSKYHRYEKLGRVYWR